MNKYEKNNILDKYEKYGKIDKIYKIISILTTILLCGTTIFACWTLYEVALMVFGM